MPPKTKDSSAAKTVEIITHDEAKQLNIPTTELSTVARKGDSRPRWKKSRFRNLWMIYSLPDTTFPLPRPHEMR
jgi:hypothetical protein